MYRCWLRVIRVGLFATLHQRIHHHRAFTQSAHQHRIEVHRCNVFVRIRHHRNHGHRHVRQRRHIQRCIAVHAGQQGDAQGVVHILRRAKALYRRIGWQNF